VGPTGPQGATGSAGTNGPTGAQGPAGPQGIAGATGATGPQGVAGPTGASGPAGTNGTNGSAVLNGSSDPAASLGVNGDFYINTSSKTLFGPKSGGLWPSGVSLVGPAGPMGGSDSVSRLWVNNNHNFETSIYVQNLSTGDSAYSSIRLSGDNGSDFIIFKNNSYRVNDGGANTATIRNDAGRLRVQSSSNIGLEIDLDGKVNIENIINIKPRPSAPLSPLKGDIYFDNNTNKLRVFDGTIWQNCW
jgi:hypothetical protein